MEGGEIVLRARRCLGTVTRLHGRAIGTGLDCVGLAAFALKLEPAQVGADYDLRADNCAVLPAQLRRAGLRGVPDHAGRRRVLRRRRCGQRGRNVL